MNTHVGAGVRMDKVAPAAAAVVRAYDEDGGWERRGRASDKTELIRAWEEELVKIEKASRRSSSNMLAFWRRREKPKETEQLKTGRVAT